MDSEFFAYFEPSTADFAMLWAKGTLVLDTNILLHFHRYPDSLREDLAAAISIFTDRTWIPYQVAIEYHEKQVSVANEATDLQVIKTVFNEALKTLKTKLDPLRNRHRGQLVERHSRSTFAIKKNLAGAIDQHASRQGLQIGNRPRSYRHRSDSKDSFGRGGAYEGLRSSSERTPPH